MIIEVWGPKAWRLIHCTAQSYPDKPTEEDKHNYYQFYHNLPYILPCCICKDHFLEQLKINPIKLGSQKELSFWLYDLHNNVNKMNKKKILTYQEADKLYHNKLYVEDINQYLIFSKKLVQSGDIPLENYNIVIFYFNVIFPSFNNIGGGSIIKHIYKP
jgi:hypothetical protein